MDQTKMMFEEIRLNVSPGSVGIKVKEISKISSRREAGADGVKYPYGFLVLSVDPASQSFGKIQEYDVVTHVSTAIASDSDGKGMEMKDMKMKGVPLEEFIDICKEDTEKVFTIHRRRRQRQETVPPKRRKKVKETRVEAEAGTIQSDITSPSVQDCIGAAHCPQLTKQVTGKQNRSQLPPGDRYRKYVTEMNQNTRLWHVPDADAPPKPSYLDFLAYCASMKSKQQKLRDMEISSNVEESSSSSEEDHGALNHYGSLPGAGEATNSTSNKSKNPKIHEIFERQMDETAAVAIGVMAEECLVSALLPLAKKHATHCRQLDLEAPISTSSSVHEWVLPPDQAIATFTGARIGLESKAPSSKNADRNVYIPSSRPPSMKGMHVASMHTHGDEQKRYFEEWCNRNALPPDFVRQNGDFFQSFLGSGHETIVTRKSSPGGGLDVLNEVEKAIRQTIETGSQFGSGSSHDHESYPIPRIITNLNISNVSMKQETETEIACKQDDGSES